MCQSGFVIIILIISILLIIFILSFCSRWCLSLLVVIVICLLCNLEPAYTTLDSWTISVANTLAALCVPFLLYQITAVIFWKCAVVQYGKVLTVVDEFIATVRKTTNVISKAIRFIQESELVVRGFTL